MNNKTTEILNMIYGHLSPNMLGISKGDILNIAYPDGHSNVDTDIPLNWTRAVEKFYPNFSRDVAPYLVWSYREEDGNTRGTPVHLITKIMNRYSNDESAADELLSMWEKL